LLTDVEGLGLDISQWRFWLSGRGAPWILPPSTALLAMLQDHDDFCTRRTEHGPRTGI